MTTNIETPTKFESIVNEYKIPQYCGETEFNWGVHKIKIVIDDDIDFSCFSEGFLDGMGLDFSNHRQSPSYGISCPVDIPRFLQWLDHGDESFEDEDVLHFQSFSDEYHWTKIHMYIHGGTTINTTGFDCAFDSGVAGIAFVLKSSFKTSKCYGVKNSDSDETCESLGQTFLSSWVEHLDDLISGRVYGYEVSYNGTITDSCYGFDGQSGYEQACLDAIDRAVDNSSY